MSKFSLVDSKYIWFGKGLRKWEMRKCEMKEMRERE
jgi:hypothetical protein